MPITSTKGLGFQPTLTGGNTPSDAGRQKLFAENPGLNTNQDLINHFLQGTDWAGGAAKAKTLGYDLAALTKNRGAALVKPQAAQTAEVAQTTQAGAATGTAATKATNLPDLGSDMFERTQAQKRAASAPLQMTDAAKTRRDAAVKQFQDTVTDVFVPTAKDLALGNNGPKTAADLSEKDLGRLQDSAKDMFMEMPVSALSPKWGGKLKGLLESKGIDTAGIESKSLKELGDYGSDFAKEMASDLKEASPAAYYGLAATGAAAVGAYGVAKGSKALEKLGVKPEFDKKFFDDKVGVQAKASWDAGMKNPNLQVGADGTFKVGNTNVRAAANAEVKSGAFAGGDVSLGASSKSGHLNADAKFSDQGLTSANIDGKKTFTHGANDADSTTLTAKGQFGEGGAVKSAEVGVAHTQKFGENDGNVVNASVTAKAGEGGQLTGVNANFDGKFKLSDSTGLDLQSKNVLNGNGGYLGGSGGFTLNKTLSEDRGSLKATGSYNLGEGGALKDATLGASGNVAFGDSKRTNLSFDTKHTATPDGYQSGTGTATLKHTLTKDRGTLTAGGNFALGQDARFQSGKAFIAGDLNVGPKGRDSFTFKSTANMGLDGQLTGTDSQFAYKQNDKTPFSLSGSAKTDGDFNFMSGSLSATQKSGNFEGSMGLQLGEGGKFNNLNVGASYVDDDAKFKTTLTGNLAADVANTNFNLSASKGMTDNWSGSMGATMTGGKLSGMNAGVRWEGDKSFLEANVERNFMDNSTTGKLSYGYRPNDRVDFAIEGSTGKNAFGQNDSRIGVGLKIRF